MPCRPKTPDRNQAKESKKEREGSSLTFPADDAWSTGTLNVTNKNITWAVLLILFLFQDVTGHYLVSSLPGLCVVYGYPNQALKVSSSKP